MVPGRQPVFSCQQNCIEDWPNFQGMRQIWLKPRTCLVGWSNAIRRADTGKKRDLSCVRWANPSFRKKRRRPKKQLS